MKVFSKVEVVTDHGYGVTNNKIVGVAQIVVMFYLMGVCIHRRQKMIIRPVVQLAVF